MPRQGVQPRASGRLKSGLRYSRAAGLGSTARRCGVPAGSVLWPAAASALLLWQGRCLRQRCCLRQMGCPGRGLPGRIPARPESGPAARCPGSAVVPAWHRGRMRRRNGQGVWPLCARGGTSSSWPDGRNSFMAAVCARGGVSGGVLRRLDKDKGCGPVRGAHPLLYGILGVVACRGLCGRQRWRSGKPSSNGVGRAT